MLKIAATLLCLSLGALGCAVAPASATEEATTDQALASPIDEAAGPIRTSCANPTSCAQFCLCDYSACVADGGSQTLCNKERQSCLAGCGR